MLENDGQGTTSTGDLLFGGGWPCRSGKGRARVRAESVKVWDRALIAKLGIIKPNDRVTNIGRQNYVLIQSDLGACLDPPQITAPTNHRLQKRAQPTLATIGS